ncbi:MAG TPA: hypothetical protein VGQ58_10620 [Candidatus Limnocylindrales bacterium]|nr:hypothetical protein [Candidatus Limnocylindrales bacterium]
MAARNTGTATDAATSDETTAKASAEATAAGRQRVEDYSLVEALIRRRSRRFALGSRLQGGAFSWDSRHDPVPLNEDEEAILAFAGTGVTGHVFGELPYQPDAGPETGGGQVMMSTVGRTQSSADAVATATLFITRDDATYAMPRPQDFAPDEFDALAALGRQRRFTEVYRRSRIQLRDRRSEIPRELPFTPPFNKWSANVPGATYFVPVSDVTGLYLTILFAALGEEFAFFFHDDKDWLVRPAGIGRFGKSKGGHLHDDVNDGRVGTIDELETYLLEILGFEQGLMIQNIALATEALGLGGFPHYAAHRFAWPKALGFETRDRTFAQLLHKGPLGTLLMRLLKKNVVIPQAVGLEHDRKPILRPFAPPYYPTMDEAVRAFVEGKFAAGFGIFRGAPTAWRDPATIQAAIPEYSEANTQAVIAYCNYVMDHYGQFPANYGPFRTLMAFQAHHIDMQFYDRFYKDGAYTDEHRQHLARWHPDVATERRR